jgi:hypothetical protein
VTQHKKKIDLRPFQSKADCQREDPLKAQYRKVGIPDVVAALQQRGDRSDDDKGPSSKQMR